MRTTLDLDEKVLTIARSKAAQDGISLGRAISDLILDALGRPIGMTERNGIPVFPAVPGHVIDLALVDKYRDGEPLDDD